MAEKVRGRAGGAPPVPAALRRFLHRHPGLVQGPRSGSRFPREPAGAVRPGRGRDLLEPLRHAHARQFHRRPQPGAPRGGHAGHAGAGPARRSARAHLRPARPRLAARRHGARGARPRQRGWAPADGALPARRAHRLCRPGPELRRRARQSRPGPGGGSGTQAGDPLLFRVRRADTGRQPGQDRGAGQRGDAARSRLGGHLRRPLRRLERQAADGGGAEVVRPRRRGRTPRRPRRAASPRRPDAANYRDAAAGWRPRVARAHRQHNRRPAVQGHERSEGGARRSARDEPLLLPHRLRADLALQARALSQAEGAREPQGRARRLPQRLLRAAAL